MEDIVGLPYDIFRTDAKSEVEEGIILDYGDFRVRIARAGGSNKKFGRMLNARLKPYKRQIDTDTFDEGVATRIMIETYADAIILGWESKDEDGEFVSGIHDEDGEIQPYSREQVMKILTDLPDLFRDIQVQADKISLFRAAQVDEEIKKSVAV